MTSLPTGTLSLQQLTLRGRPGLEASRLRQELEWAPWSSSADEGWVFIRQLRVQARPGELGRQLVAQTREALNRGEPERIHFASLTDLLTALALDLAQPSGTPHWYWQPWSSLFSLPPGVGLSRLLGQHPEALTAVCARLAERRQLAHVWKHLDEAGAHSLLETQARRAGITALPPAPESPVTNEPPLPLPTHRHKGWTEALTDLPARDPRHRLGLLLAALETVPLLLQQSPARTLARLAEALHPPGPDRLPTPPLPAHHPSPAGQPTPPHTGVSPEKTGFSEEANTHYKTANQASAALQTPETAHLTPAAPAPDKPARPTPTPVSPPADPSTPASHAVAAPSPISRLRSAEPAPATPAPPVTAPDTGFCTLLTRQGGLLYLLNFLNRPEAQTLLRTHAQTLPSGWGWLYRLGQELALDETDPLLDFIATQLGLTHREALQELPPLPARTGLLALVQRWYQPTGLWTPGLLALDARLQATPSHLDLYASLHAVRLPLRLAGLDLNPGWLPWLGRVVTFHFD